MTAYLFFRDIHNIVRWLVELSCFWALFRVWSGLINRRVWTKQEKIAGLAFTSILNVQFVIGLILLFVGPMHTAYSNMAATMKNPEMRFFAVEHPFMMFLAVVIAQAGFSLAKRAGNDRSKYVRATICYTVSAILIFVSIPWPFMKVARPYFPQFLG